MNVALIVFAGKGIRLGSQIPKQFLKVAGRDVVAYTIEKFEQHPLIDNIVLVTSEDYISYTQNMVFSNRFSKVAKIVKGGETRQESVLFGLRAIDASDNDLVLIHDGDRPLIKDELITKCIKGINNPHNDGVVVAIKSENEIPSVKNLGRKVERNNILYDIQTPQCFKTNYIKFLHEKYKDATVSDDASLVEKEGGYVALIDGDPYNFKITTNEDLQFFKKIIEEK